MNSFSDAKTFRQPNASSDWEQRDLNFSRPFDFYARCEDAALLALVDVLWLANFASTPSKPTRAFWEKVLSVALDDLANLVAPEEVVICEGNPAGAIPGKNAEHDATIYNTIFGEEMPDVKFIAGGNAKNVASDRLGFVAALPKLASGIKVKRLIDRDDHSPADVAQMVTAGITTLSRRNLESYTYDDEVLAALCVSVGKSDETAALLTEKQHVNSRAIVTP